jgi:uncharacterized membrane protein
MRALQGTLCAVAIASLLALRVMSADQSRAQQPAPEQPPPAGYFAFKVCNQSSYRVMMAVVYLQAPNSNNFINSGWWIFEPHSPCVNWPGGNRPGFLLPKGMFYHHEESAERREIYWPADDIKHCVQYPGPWQQIWVKDTTYSCGKWPRCRFHRC